MNFKKIRSRVVITAAVLAMTVVPQAVSAACAQTQDTGNSYCLTSDSRINWGNFYKCGFRCVFWDCGFGSINGNSGNCSQPGCGSDIINGDDSNCSQPGWGDQENTPGSGDGDQGENTPDGTPGDNEGNTPGIGDNEGIQPGEQPGSGSGEDDTISGGDSSGSQNSSYGSEVTDLVNQQRLAKGLSSLSYDSELTRLAQMKAEDMAKNHYFSHQSPTYGSAFDLLKSAGVSYRSAGENIARGQKTPAAVMDSWMNSQGHRENILNSSYTSIGVGYAVDDSGRACWVQIFKG